LGQTSLEQELDIVKFIREKRMVTNSLNMTLSPAQKGISSQFALSKALKLASKK
jgi:hypothetical protein